MVMMVQLAVSRQNIAVDDMKDNRSVSFYTGFQSYAVDKASYQFLLPAAETLTYVPLQ